MGGTHDFALLIPLIDNDMTNEKKAPAFKNQNADGNFLRSLFRNKGGLKEGYRIKLEHYENLYSTVVRDYTTDYFLKENFTDRQLIDEMAIKIHALDLNYSIHFSRTMRLTNGRLNGYVGLSEITLEILDFSKKTDHLKFEELVVKQIEILGKEMSMPVKYVKSEPPFMYGGSESWNVIVFFRCMPNLKGQRILTEIVDSWYPERS